MPSDSLITQKWRANSATDFHPEKRPVVGYDGVVASTHSLGSVAGAEMLAAGGNAIDAAVATLFTLSVVEPMKMGIYGAGFINIRLSDGAQVAIDNYSQAPGAASPEMFEPMSDRWPHYMRARGDLNRTGVLASAVPGSLKAWCEVLAEFGTMDLSDVMQPAIRYAEHGFRASRYYCDLVRESAEQLGRYSESRRIFMPDGDVPDEGDLITQRELAETLRRIAVEGSDHLYAGDLGDRIVEYSQQNGGILTKDDLRSYRTRRSVPIIGSYRGYEIAGPPPPSAGGVHVVELLNVLELENIADLGFGEPRTLHLLAEAMQLVFESRNRYLGDPKFREMPLDRLTSDFHAEELRSRILPDISMPTLPPPSFAESRSTSHVSAADADGNVVSATQTINLIFGSKVVVPGTGVILDNTMANFDPHPFMANSIEPFKRVASSMAPVIVSKDGQPSFALGLPGGVRIWPTVVQGIMNVVDHGMTPQEAVEAPRMWTQGQEVELEEGFNDLAAEGLRDRGHEVAIVKNVAGGMCMLAFNDNGTISGTTCWRSDGGALAAGGGKARSGITLSAFPSDVPTTAN